MTEYAALGTAFAIGDSATVATANYTDIAQIRNISGPSMSSDPIDVTSHDSTNGYREFVVALKDMGEITLDLIYDPDQATHANSSGGLFYEYTQATKKAYRLTLVDTSPTTIKFQAYVTAFNPTNNFDGSMDAAVTLKITGAPTIA